MPYPPIVAEALTKQYSNIRALVGLSFAVEQGSVFALLGPNGAGKSTAVKVLTTLALPDAGHAFVTGIDVVAHPRQVRRVIGVVSQQPAVDLDATGRENLTLQGQLHGLSGGELRGRVEEMLARFQLTAAADRMSQVYSGGMQRKLEVAMGLVHRPSVLFLDEPTTGLDPEARAELWHEIGRLAREDGATILLTTHYLDEADHLANRVAIVDGGRVVIEGTPDELKAGLRGDAVQVELVAMPDESDLLAALRPLGTLVREVTMSGRTLRARADDGARALPTILAALETSNLGVASATVSRPSLDDVYLAHTGRVFGDSPKGNAA